MGPHGTIKYYIEVIVEQPGVEEDHRVRLLEFVVESPQRKRALTSVPFENCFEFEMEFQLSLQLSIGCSQDKELGLLNLADGKVILSFSDVFILILFFINR